MPRKKHTPHSWHRSTSKALTKQYSKCVQGCKKRSKSRRIKAREHRLAWMSDPSAVPPALARQRASAAARYAAKKQVPKKTKKSKRKGKRRGKLLLRAANLIL